MEILKADVEKENVRIEEQKKVIEAQLAEVQYYNKLLYGSTVHHINLHIIIFRSNQ